MQDSAIGVRVHKLPTSSQRKPLFIVGDVHGCAVELEALVKKAQTILPPFQLVLVGDLFTKGPHPMGVYDIIQEYEAICIQGNHDWFLRTVLDSVIYHARPLASLPFCTKQTLHAIRYHKQVIWKFLNSLPHAYTSTIELAVHKKGWTEASYPLIIVHAGYDVEMGLTQTTERVMLTARYVRWEQEPSGFRRLVVTGPMPDPDGRWEAFRWHELHQGPELIVFGHDAKQGLLRKVSVGGRPICIGLDTGCTYGNSLTGYCPEWDIAIQVRAERRYFDSQRSEILL